MGTRSLTVMLDEEDNEIVVMYRQFDGYPTGYGQELASYLAGFIIVNGMRLNEKRDKIANGAACLAAQIVAHFKQDVGGIYLHPAGTRDCGEEYLYEVHPNVGENVMLTAYCGYGDMEQFYHGFAQDFDGKKLEEARSLEEE